MIIDLYSTDDLSITDPYIQLYQCETNMLFNFTTGALAAADAGTYTDFDLEPHATNGRTNAGAFNFTFPDTIPAGVYTLLLKNAASPSTADTVVDFERINIRKTPSGEVYFGNPSRIFRSR